MPSQESIKGIVLRVVPTGDGNNLLTVLTGSRGKITLSAPGSRSVSSQRHAMCQPFAYGELFISQRKGDRWYLKEGVPEEIFYPLREDLNRFALAGYIADVTLQVATEEEEQEDLLRLLLNTLYVLCYRDKPIWFVKAVFEWRLAAIMGFEPDLFACMECGKTEPPFAFVLSEGQLICAECMMKEGAPPAHPLEVTLPLLRSLLRVPLQKLYSFEADEGMQGELSSLCEKHLLTHLEYTPSTLRFYKSVVE